jgi:hypothetical protein
VREQLVLRHRLIVPTRGVGDIRPIPQPARRRPARRAITSVFDRFMEAGSVFGEP